MDTFSALLAICAGNPLVPANSPLKGQRCGALMFSLICARINICINNREAGDLKRHRAHYDVIVMVRSRFVVFCCGLMLNNFGYCRRIIYWNRNKQWLCSYARRQPWVMLVKLDTNATGIVKFVTTIQSIDVFISYGIHCNDNVYYSDKCASQMILNMH